MGPIEESCEDLYSVVCHKTCTVNCGLVNFGFDHPIVRQTMGTAKNGNV